MNFHRLFLSFAVLLLTLWPGCAEDPSDVGVGVLPAGDLPLFIVDTVTAQAGGTTRAIPLTARGDAEVAVWYPQQLFVGGVQTLVAGSFVRFEQFPDTLTGVSIEAADLILVRTSFVGDSLLTPAFTMHRPLRPWFGDSLSYDSVRASGLYVESAPLPPGVGTGVVDTVPGSVSYPLDTALVRQWFTTVVDSGVTNLGVFLRGSANGLVQGYGSFLHLDAGTRPRLRVSYRRNGISNSAVFSTGTSRYVADLPSGDLVLDPSKVYVQSGVAYRGLVTFDVSAFPRPVSVGNAVLEITLDSAASNIVAAPDSLLAIFVDANAAPLKASAVVSDRTTLNGMPMYAFRLPAFAQQWLQTTTPATVMLAAYRENMNFDRFVLHGASAALQIRPRLILTYSKAIATYGGRR
jgi:hypothetical protein